jgi:integrase
MKAEHRMGWHPRGGWCRTFPGDRSRTYFGRISPGLAVRAMLAAEDRRRAGESAEDRMGRLRLREAANLFLAHLDAEYAAGKIGHEQRASYGQEIDALITAAGKNRPLYDFCKLNAPDALFKPLRAAALARGLAAAEKHIVQVRTFLNWCSGVRRLIPAPFYADAFAPPGEREKRATRKAARREKGEAYWQPAEVCRIVDVSRLAGVHRFAQVLLMLNGGMGSTDLALLEDADVDWDRNCIHTDRSKTLVPRVVPLWDVTAGAMRVSRAARAKPERPEWAARFFLTDKGRPLVTRRLSDKDARRTAGTDTLKNWFYVLLNGRGGHPGELADLKRHRAGAYTLRSVFLTLSVGQDADLRSVVMGHAFKGEVTEFYLRGDLREKLAGLCDQVRSQLWPAGGPEPWLAVSTTAGRA